MGEREGGGGAPSVSELLNQYNSKKDSYLRDAFLKNRQLRALYRNLGIGVINALAANVMSMNAAQRTIIKDISLFTNLIDISDSQPPLPQITYQGSTTTLNGKTIPEIPIFVFTQPTIEIEQATAQVIASMFVIQINRDANTKDPDFENTFAKYYRFSTISVSGGGSVAFGTSINLAPLTTEGIAVLNPTDTLVFDQKILLTRDIVDTNNNPLLTVNNFIYLGILKTALDRGELAPKPIDLPLVVARFEAIAPNPANRDIFQGIRIMNTLCRGSATAQERYVGQITIIRQAGFSGSVFCSGVG